MEQTPSRLTIHGQDGMITIDEGMVPVASSDEVTLFASELVKLELLMSYNQPRSITLRCAHSRHPRLFVSAVLTGVGLHFRNTVDGSISSCVAKTPELRERIGAAIVFARQKRKEKLASEWF